MQTVVLTSRAGPGSPSCSHLPRAVKSLETFLHLGVSTSPGPLHSSDQLVWLLLSCWDTGVFKTFGLFTEGLSIAEQCGIRGYFVMSGTWGFLEGVL